MHRQWTVANETAPVRLQSAAVVAQVLAGPTAVPSPVAPVPVPTGSGVTGSAGFARVTTDNGSVQTLSGPASTSVTAAYTVAAADDVVYCDATAGAYAVTLQASGASAGQLAIIQKTDSSANAVTVTPTSPDTMDGLASVALSLQYDTIAVYGDGTNWNIVGRAYGLGAANKVLRSGDSGGLFTAGALDGADLPNPSASTLGGVRSIAAVSHNFVTSISTSGVPAQAQPAFTDISGVATAAQLPNPTASTIGGVESIAAVSHNFLTSISTSGVPAQAQPAFTDISGVATVAQGGTGDSTLTTHGVLVGAAASAVAVTAAGASGAVLTGQGASADPLFEALSAGATMTNLGVVSVRSRRSICITTASTPVASTDEKLSVPLPYADDGTTSVTWTFTKLTFLVGTVPVSTAATATLKLAGTSILSSNLSIAAAGTSASTTTFNTATGASGQLLLISPGTVSSSDFWTLTLEMWGIY